MNLGRSDGDINNEVYAHTISYRTEMRYQYQACTRIVFMVVILERMGKNDVGNYSG